MNPRNLWYRGKCHCARGHMYSQKCHLPNYTGWSPGHHRVLGSHDPMSACSVAACSGSVTTLGSFPRKCNLVTTI